MEKTDETKEINTDQKIYAVKAATGQERIIAEIMYKQAKRIKKEDDDDREPVYSVFYTTSLKGYVLVEADNPGAVEDLARNIPKTRGLLRGTISIEELEKTMFPTPIIEEIHKGDTVEIINGPFKGEKAKVVRFDANKNEVTIELIEAAIPIPITVTGRDLKILKGEK
ncbi:MAG: transcription elongation factor Spt5 [Candidatus Altiarchaeales archaeon HGW-Altiarchaeales-3]|nr:MAG: transcription elongation factor Spt5 [Candidatus Altiarchaeales archaeon HGW-Altiarchaeales-3]